MMTSQTIATGNAGGAHPTISKVQLWGGRVMSGFAGLFLLVDGGMKLFKPAVVLKATRELGYPESEIVGIGVLVLGCTLLYLFPRTSIVGAILLTGHLGGAIASQVRIEAPWFNIIFAFMLGCLVWGGLWLRDTRVRSFLPYQH